MPAPAGSRSRPTIADRVEQLTIFQRTAQWIIPNPMYHATVPPGDRWAQRHLPFYGRWFRFIMTFPGIAVGIEPYRRDPEHDDPTSTSVNATQRAATGHSVARGCARCSPTVPT